MQLLIDDELIEPVDRYARDVLKEQPSMRQKKWIEATCPDRLRLLTAAKLAKDAAIISLKLVSTWRIFFDRGVDPLVTDHPLLVFGLENSRVVIARFDVLYFNGLLACGLFGAAELCFRHGYWRNFFFPLLLEAADYSSLVLTTRILGEVVNMMRIFRIPRGEAARLRMLRDLRSKYAAFFGRYLWFIPEPLFEDGTAINRVAYASLIVAAVLRAALVTLVAAAVLLARLSFVADAIAFLQHERWARGATMALADLSGAQRTTFVSVMLDLLAVATPTPAHRILRHRQLDVFSEPARLMEQRLLRFASPTRYLNYAFLLPSEQLHFLLLMDERFAAELELPAEPKDPNERGGVCSPPSRTEVAVGWVCIGACVCIVVPLSAVIVWLVNGLWWKQMYAGTGLRYVALAAMGVACATMFINIGVATVVSKHGWYFADAAAEHRLAFREDESVFSDDGADTSASASAGDAIALPSQHVQQERVQDLHTSTE